MLDAEAANVFVRQMFDLYVGPELQRRGLSTETPVGAFQVVFFNDGRTPVVRLDDEIRVSAEVKLRSGVLPEPDGRILLSDIEIIESSRLPPDDDPNAGHATVIFYGDFRRFHASFDFRYNRGRANRHLELARGFLEQARLGLAANLLRPSVDNLFSAMELASLAWLVMHHGNLLATKTHSPVHSELNRQAHLRNVEPNHASTLNRLRDLRQSARYLEAGPEVDEGEVATLWSTVSHFIDWVAVQLAPYGTEYSADVPRDR